MCLPRRARKNIYPWYPCHSTHGTVLHITLLQVITTRVFPGVMSSLFSLSGNAVMFRLIDASVGPTSTSVLETRLLNNAFWIIARRTLKNAVFLKEVNSQIINSNTLTFLQLTSFPTPGWACAIICICSGDHDQCLVFTHLTHMPQIATRNLSWR